MFLNTQVDDLQKLFTANTTAATITNRTPTPNEPKGNGILNGRKANQALLFFHGAGSNNQTMTARITAWSKTSLGLWVPTPLLGLDIILGPATGTVAGEVVATELFADTISVTSGTGFTSAYEIISPADNTIACIKIDTFGSPLVQVDLAKGTCTSCNALGRMF